MFVRVERYAVDVIRQLRPYHASIWMQCETVGFGPTHEPRRINVYLRFVENGDDRYEDMPDAYVEEEHIHKRAEFGYRMRTPELAILEGQVRVLLPLRDYDRMYHLLQTESPVYAHWEPDTHDEWMEVASTGATWPYPAFFKLTTFDEPTGEGYDERD